MVAMSSTGDDPTVHVDDIIVVEGADHLADGVGLTDGGKELVAQPLALGRAADNAGDVDEPHVGGNDPPQS